MPFSLSLLCHIMVYNNLLGSSLALFPPGMVWVVGNSSAKTILFESAGKLLRTYCIGTLDVRMRD